MNLDREEFFNGLRKAFGGLNQKQVDAIGALLDAIEADAKIDDTRHVAYILATIKHETANTYAPIEEIGKGKGRPYGKKDPETGFAYYGRGFVQLTWRKNYEKLGNLLGVDLVSEPQLALDPEIAWQVTSLGMRHGLFTGKKLSDFINKIDCDYMEARRIINGTDKAALIAGYALKFERILNSASLPVAKPEAEKPTATPPDPEPPPAEGSQPAANIPAGSFLDQPVQIAKDNSGKLANWMVGAASAGTLAGFWEKNQTLIVVGLIVVAVMVLAIFLVNKALKLFEAHTAASKHLNTVQFVKK